MTRNICGKCEHAVSVMNPEAIGENNLTCFSFPPQLVIVSNKNNASMISARPTVRETDPCCQFFSPRSKVI